jgi:hypothetical protein
MSWASARQTTQTEDRAYCLLGLFDINMPLLYGGGSKAFQRLQLEIVQRTTDLSFLAWQTPVDWSRTSNLLSLALTPDVFCLDKVMSRTAGTVSYVHEPTHMRVTNLGLSVRVQLVDTLDPNLKFAVILPAFQSRWALWMPVVKVHDVSVRINFISSTSLVPRLPCRVVDTSKEIVLPIHDQSRHRSTYTDKSMTLSPSPQPTVLSILLTFPTGLRGYRVLDRCPATRATPGPAFLETIRRDKLLLRLMKDHDEAGFQFAAIQFGPASSESRDETVIKMPHGRRECQHLTILFVMQEDNTGRPTNWTCVDISHQSMESTHPSSNSLAARAKIGLRTMRGRGPRSWSQSCVLSGTSTEPRQSGHVRMDYLQRDLSSSDLGGYGPSSAEVDAKSGSADHPGYYPLLAQIVLPP